MNPLNWISPVWDFIVNPPAEVVKATGELGAKLVSCGVTAAIDFGNKLLEVIVGIV